MKSLQYSSQKLRRYVMCRPPLVSVAMPPLVFGREAQPHSSEGTLPLDNAFILDRVRGAIPEGVLHPQSEHSPAPPSIFEMDAPFEENPSWQDAVVPSPRPTLNCLVDLIASQLIATGYSKGYVYETIAGGYEINGISTQFLNTLLQHAMNTPEALDELLEERPAFVPYVIGCDCSKGSGVASHDGPLICTAFSRFLVEVDADGSLLPVTASRYRDIALEETNELIARQQFSLSGAASVSAQPASASKQVKPTKFPLAEEDEADEDDGESSKTFAIHSDHSQSSAMSSTYVLPQEFIPLGGHYRRSQAEKDFAFEHLLFGTEYRKALGKLTSKDKETTSSSTPGATKWKLQAKWKLQGDLSLPFELPQLSVSDIGFHGLREAEDNDTKAPVTMLAMPFVESSRMGLNPSEMLLGPAEDLRELPECYESVKTWLSEIEKKCADAADGFDPMAEIISSFVRRSAKDRMPPLIVTIPFLSVSLVPADKSTYYERKSDADQTLVNKKCKANTVEDMQVLLRSANSSDHAALDPILEAIWDSQQVMYPSLFESKIETTTTTTTTSVLGRSTTSTQTKQEIIRPSQRYFINMGAVAIVNRSYMNLASEGAGEMNGISCASIEVMKWVKRILEEDKNGLRGRWKEERFEPIKNETVYGPRSPIHNGALNLLVVKEIERRTANVGTAEFDEKASAGLERRDANLSRLTQEVLRTEQQPQSRDISRNGRLRVNGPLIIVNGKHAPSELLRLCHDMRTYGDIDFERGVCLPMRGCDRISYTVAASTTIATKTRELVMEAHHDALRKSVIEGERLPRPPPLPTTDIASAATWESLTFDDS